MHRLLFLLMLVLFTFSSLSAQGETPASWCVAAWYPSSEHPGGYDSLLAHADEIDVVHPFWYSPAPDGSLIAHDGAEDEAQLAAWRAAGMRIIPSIFSSLSGMIETPEARETHIAAIMARVQALDYDGIDVDYEGFPLSTRDSFSEFIEGLAEALHADGRTLSIAVHAKTSDAGSWEGAAAQDWSRIAPAVDILNVMTYDYTSRNQPPGPIAPANWIMDVLAYTESMTDLGKVRMGLNFYGYTWVRGNPPATTTSWESVQRLIDAFDPIVERDPLAMEAYTEIRGRGLPRQTIYFADSDGLYFKISSALEQFPNLGGVAIWGLGGEDETNWDVLAELRPASCTSLSQAS